MKPFWTAVCWRLETSSRRLGRTLGLVSVSALSIIAALHPPTASPMAGSCASVPGTAYAQLTGVSMGKKKKRRRKRKKKERILSSKYQGCVLWLQTATSDHRGADPEGAIVASPPIVGIPFPSGVLRRITSRFLVRSFRGQEAVGRYIQSAKGEKKPINQESCILQNYSSNMREKLRHSQRNKSWGTLSCKK